jgi:hypothetical protein
MGEARQRTILASLLSHFCGRHGCLSQLLALFVIQVTPIEATLGAERIDAHLQYNKPMVFERRDESMQVAKEDIGAAVAGRKDTAARTKMHRE